MGDISGAPWWGKGHNMVLTLGPITVAFFLILFVGFGWMPSPILQSMADSTDVLKKNHRIMTDIRDEVAVHTREVRDQQRALLSALRQICRNTAKTPQQNERCDDM